MHIYNYVCVSDFSPWIIAYHCQVYEYGRTCNHVYVNRVFFLVSTEGPTGSVATTPLVGHKNSCTHLYTFVLNGWAFTKKIDYITNNVICGSVQDWRIPQFMSQTTCVSWPCDSGYTICGQNHIIAIQPQIWYVCVCVSI
jgi:hypothetical protein